MSKEAATKLMAKMSEHPLFFEAYQYHMYYINLLNLVINEKPLTEDNYNTLTGILKKDISYKEAHSAEAEILLNCLSK